MSSTFRDENFTGNEISANRSFEDSVVVNCSFSSYTLEGANLIHAVFVGCKFDSVDFYWANAYATRFIRCSLEKVDFRGANMAETAFIECTLKRCDFGRDNLGGYTDLVTASFIDSPQINCRYESRSAES